jgi:hypothetical protein
MRRYVFVSHANDDKTRLRPLLEAILDAGIPLWIDRPEEIGLGERHLNCGRIMPGADWQQEIRAALEHASCVLFVLSRASNSSARSDELAREFEHGKSRNMLVIAQIDPIDQAELNPFFRLRQVLDVGPPAIARREYSQRPKFDVLVTRLREQLIVNARQLPAPAMPAAAAPNAPARRPPRLLPYLTDRREQQQGVAAVLQAQIDRKETLPTTFFTLGCEDECADSFVEQLKYVRLPELLGANGLPEEVLFRHLRWPIGDDGGLPWRDDEIARQFADVEAQVRQALGVKVTADAALITRKLANNPVCCCFHIGIALGDWGPGQLRLLRRWLDWWGGMDFSSVGLPVVGVVSVVYPAGWLPRLRLGGALRRLRRDLQRLLREAPPGTAVHALPELRNVRFEDVDQWIRELVDNVDREVLRRQLRRHFSRRFAFGRRRLSMYDTAAMLKTALSDPAVRVSAP